MVTRRGFLKRLACGALAAVSVPMVLRQRHETFKFWPCRAHDEGFPWRAPCLADRYAEAEAWYRQHRAVLSKARVYPTRATYWEI